MKRKVIQLAGKTFVVSLPTSWARQWGVKKGEEIEVTEHGPKLIISTSQAREIKKSDVNLGNATERTIRWVLSSLHKKGYDEIEVITDTPEQATLVDELLKDLFIGFAVIHRTNNKCIIRSVSQDLDDQFDTILRRAFLVTLNLAEQSHELFSNEQFEELANLLDLEKTNNQLTNFCERMLNKHGHKDPIKTTFLYTIVWNLEKVADDYKYLCNHAQKISKKTLDLYKRTNVLLRRYYELFYAFDLNVLNELATEQRKLRDDIKEDIYRSRDAVVLSHLWHIVLKTADFSASTFALHH